MAFNAAPDGVTAGQLEGDFANEVAGGYEAATSTTGQFKIVKAARGGGLNPVPNADYIPVTDTTLYRGSMTAGNGLPTPALATVRTGEAFMPGEQVLLTDNGDYGGLTVANAPTISVFNGAGDGSLPAHWTLLGEAVPSDASRLILTLPVAEVALSESPQESDIQAYVDNNNLTALEIVYPSALGRNHVFTNLPEGANQVVRYAGLEPRQQELSVLPDPVDFSGDTTATSFDGDIVRIVESPSGAVTDYQKTTGALGTWAEIDYQNGGGVANAVTQEQMTAAIAAAAADIEIIYPIWSAGNTKPIVRVIDGGREYTFIYLTGGDRGVNPVQFNNTDDADPTNGCYHWKLLEDTAKYPFDPDLYIAQYFWRSMNPDTPGDEVVMEVYIGVTAETRQEFWTKKAPTVADYAVNPTTPVTGEIAWLAK